MTDQPKPNQPPNPSSTVPAQSSPKEVAPAVDNAPSSAPSPNEAKPPAVPVTDTKPEPKPESSGAPSTDAKPESKPEGAPVSTNGLPTKPSNGSAQPTPPAKPPANPEPNAAPSVPAAPVSPSSPTVKRDISDDPTLPGKPAEMTNPTKPHQPSGPDKTVPLTPAQVAAAIAGSKEDTIPPGGSGTKVTQRFSESSPVGQVSAGTICPSCGHRNRPGTLICDNCGTNLVGGVKSSVGTRDLVSAAASAPPDEPLMTAAQLNAVESAGGTVFSDDMVLRIEIEGGATPMLVYPKQEIILGRRDPNTGTLPDVDMTAYSGYRMGVSRTHASIRLQDKQLNLSDRGSSNGTFLNGTRLVAHRPYPIKDGDEIRLGQMVLKIFFQSNKPRK